MTALTTRLVKLESFLTLRPGCRVCRRWTPATVCDATGACLRPDRCPTCGRSVPVADRIRIAGLSLERI
jgi:hypothetical protein